MSQIKFKKTATIFIILPLLVFAGVSLIGHGKKLVLGTETNIFPEEIQQQEIVLGEEEHAPVGSGFPSLSVFPGSSYIKTTQNENSIEGLWHVNEKLTVVTAWEMFMFYDAGWFMESVPSDSLSEHEQNFTAIKGDMKVKFTGTSNGSTTYFSMEYFKVN